MRSIRKVFALLLALCFCFTACTAGAESLAANQVNAALDAGRLVTASIQIDPDAEFVAAVSGDEYVAVADAIRALTLTAGFGAEENDLVGYLAAAVANDSSVAGTDAIVRIGMKGITVENEMLPDGAVSIDWATAAQMGGADESIVAMLEAVGDMTPAEAINMLIEQASSAMQNFDIDALRQSAVNALLMPVITTISGMTPEAVEGITVDGVEGTVSGLVYHVTVADMAGLMKGIADGVETECAANEEFATVLSAGLVIGGFESSVEEVIATLRNTAAEVEGTEQTIVDVTFGANETGDTMYGCADLAPIGMNADLVGTLKMTENGAQVYVSMKVEDEMDASVSVLVEGNTISFSETINSNDTTVSYDYYVVQNDEEHWTLNGSVVVFAEDTNAAIGYELAQDGTAVDGVLKIVSGDEELGSIVLARNTEATADAENSTTVLSVNASGQNDLLVITDNAFTVLTEDNFLAEHQITAQMMGMDLGTVTVDVTSMAMPAAVQGTRFEDITDMDAYSEQVQNNAMSKVFEIMSALPPSVMSLLQ